MPRIPKHVRAAVFERDGFACVRCGGTERLGIDHVVPLSKGGTDDLDNLRVLCLGCNAAKGNRTDPRYLQPVRDVGKHRKAVLRARENLDAANREYVEAIRDAHAQGHSYVEIAQALGISRQAVRQLLTR